MIATNWEEAAKENPEEYIACVTGWKEYESSGMIDAGALLSIMRQHMDYSFVSKMILEYGCGNGRMTQFLRRFFSEYFTVDISPTMLNLLGQKLLNTSSLLSDHIFEIPSNFFDIAFSFTVLMHNEKEDVFEVMKELYRILKPGGFAFIQLPCYPNQRDIVKFNDVAIWNEAELNNLFKDFHIIKLEVEKEPLTYTISDKHFKYHVLKK